MKKLVLVFIIILTVAGGILLVRHKMAQLAAAPTDTARPTPVRVAIAKVSTVNARAVVQAEEALRVEKLKYATGKGTINDVLDAEAARFNADSLERKARRYGEIGRLNLYLALGRIEADKT